MGQRSRGFSLALLPALAQFAPASCDPQPPSAPRCDTNYSGCVPIASDVDCADGTGDGPAYTGPLQVIGRDVHGLDRDHDGWAC